MGRSWNDEVGYKYSSFHPLCNDNCFSAKVVNTPLFKLPYLIVNWTKESYHTLTNEQLSFTPT